MSDSKIVTRANQSPPPKPPSPMLALIGHVHALARRVLALEARPLPRDGASITAAKIIDGALVLVLSDGKEITVSGWSL